MAVSFRFGLSESNWLWSNFPFGAMVLVVISLSFALIWVRIEKKKTQNLSNKITSVTEENPFLYKNKLNLLTTRQREIFELIVSGKSNKEIIDELFIELSTLKTHINKIYKALGISSRKEAKAFNRINETENS